MSAKKYAWTPETEASLKELAEQRKALERKTQPGTFQNAILTNITRAQEDNVINGPLPGRSDWAWDVVKTGAVLAAMAAAGAYYLGLFGENKPQQDTPKQKTELKMTPR